MYTVSGLQGMVPKAERTALEDVISVNLDM